MKKCYPQYFVIAPVVIYMVFFLLPSSAGFIYAFTDWNPFLDKISFVGLDNFYGVLSNRNFGIAAENTILFTVVTVILKNLFGLIIAIALNRKLKTTKILRTVYFLPVVFSALVVGLIATAIFDTHYGVINKILVALGGEHLAFEWLGNRGLANIAIISTEVWRSTGYAVVILLAGLQSIPQHYYEAASIDGASGWQKFKSVTLPLIMAPLNFNILLSILYGFKMFDLVYIMTSGGPGHDTETFSTLILNEFAQNRYASSVAMNLLFSALLVVIAILYQKFANKVEVEL